MCEGMAKLEANNSGKGGSVAGGAGTPPTPVGPDPAEASPDLCQHPLLLSFYDSALEGRYLAETAGSRWVVLTLILFFDLACFVLRTCVKLASAQLGTVAWEMGPQLANLALLHMMLALANRRSRQRGPSAARQEEVLVAGLVALAVCALLLTVRGREGGDYVYVAFFLICSGAVLKVRWFLGAGILAAPLLLAALPNLAQLARAASGDAACGLACGAAAAAAGSGGACPALGGLPLEALVHICVAWAVGCLMTFLADSNRRQSFAAHQHVLFAAEKKVVEVKRRASMERELLAAQAQAEARALVLAREKLANETKSEFMSLMCHEVRTPLNGCLASAEMLLDTELDTEQRELAKTIRVSGSILLSTVSNFLDFFKIEAGKQLDIVRSPMDLRDLVMDVHCIIEAMVGRGSDVQLLPPDLTGVPPTVLGDPSRLCGILLNLYTNAAKYTKRGSIGLRVRVVGANYRPDASHADKFVARTTPVSSRSTSRASGSTSVARSSILSAALGEGSSTECSTPRAAGAESAGAFSARAQHQHGAHYAHDSAGSMQSAAAGGHGGSTPLPCQVSGRAGSSSASSNAGAAGMQTLHEDGGWHSVYSEADLRMAGRVAQPADSTPPSSDGEEAAPVQLLAFEVLDSGVGVAPRSLEQLFQQFVQGSDSDMRRPRTKGGTGLGLSICSKQVAVLGGSIGALSKLGAGSVFWFTIPMQLPRASSSSDGLEEPTQQPAGAAAVRSCSGVDADTKRYDDCRNHSMSSPTQAAGAAALRRSLDLVLAAASEALGGSRRLAHHHAPSEAEVGASGQQAIDRNLSSMWPAHSKPPRPNAHAEPAGSAGASPRCYAPPRDYAPPRTGFSWDQPSQPPSFTAAQMLQAMPMGESAAAASQAVAPSSSTAAAPAAANGGVVLSGLRVLLCEDNLINQTVAKRVLTTLGCDCRVSSNGREAVTAVEESVDAGAPFDVVLMDMCMPVLSGVEATEEIRKLGCSIPIVAMTANASDRDRDECIAAGMDGFLSKPVLKEQLTIAIRDAIRGGVRGACTPGGRPSLQAGQ